MLFAATRSPFTYGLEAELRKLAHLSEESIRNTALGLWLRGESIEATHRPKTAPSWNFCRSILNSGRLYSKASAHLLRW